MAETTVIRHDPIPMRRVGGYDEMRLPGDFYWNGEPGTEDHELVLAMPTKHFACGEFTEDNRGYARCREHVAPITYFTAYGWSIGRVNTEGAQWTWNGDLEKPTLRPSLDARGVWHGWVTDGTMYAVAWTP